MVKIVLVFILTIHLNVVGDLLFSLVRTLYMSVHSWKW